MTEIILNVPSVNCNGCVNKIKTGVGALTGVQTVDASFETKLVTVAFAAPATQAQIETTLAALNHPAVKAA